MHNLTAETNIQITNYYMGNGDLEILKKLLKKRIQFEPILHVCYKSKKKIIDYLKENNLLPKLKMEKVWKTEPGFNFSDILVIPNCKDRDYNGMNGLVYVVEDLIKETVDLNKAIKKKLAKSNIIIINDLVGDIEKYSLSSL